MLLKVLFCIFIFISSGFTANIISYTAVSNVSQEEADQLALAGLSRQISSQITTHQTLTQKETKKENSFDYEKTFTGNSSVSSQVLLKNVRILPEKKKNGKFSATASVDLDFLKSLILTQMKEIQNSISQKETLFETSLSKSDFVNAAQLIHDIKKQVQNYPPLLKELSFFDTVQENHLLKTQIDSLTVIWNKTLREISITGHISIRDSSISLEVRRGEIPVPYFPLLLQQNKKTISHTKTDVSGKISAPIHSIKINPSGTHSLFIFSNIPYFSSLIQPLELSYTNKTTPCDYQLICKEKEIFCNIIRQKFSEAGFDLKQEASPIEFTLKTIPSDSLQSGFSENLISVKIFLSLKGKDFLFSTELKGVGTHEENAIRKALEKLQSKQIRRQAQSFCGDP